MTAPLPDDQVRAMLEERAGRVSPDAEREAMSAFRAAVRGAPDGKGGFTVIPQALSSRDARLPGGLAAFGVVVVVVIAVLGGRLSGDDVATSPSAVAGSGAITGPAESLAPSGCREPDRSGSGSARGGPRVGRPRGQDRRDQRQARVGAVQRARIRLQDAPPRVAAAADHGVRRAIHSGRLGCGDRRPCRTDDVSSRRRWLARLPRGPRQRSRRADVRRPADLDDRARRTPRRGPRDGSSDATRVALLVLTGARRRPTERRRLANGLQRRAGAGDGAQLGTDWRAGHVRRAAGQRGVAPRGPLRGLRADTPSAQAGQDDLTADQLRAGLADGSLTGRVIVIDGVLRDDAGPVPEARRVRGAQPDQARRRADHGGPGDRGAGRERRA